MMAARRGDVAMAKLLLENGALTDRAGLGFDAPPKKNIDLFAAIIIIIVVNIPKNNNKKNRVSSSRIETESQTALHVAANEGHTNITELLIEQGADLNPKDKGL